MDYDTHYLGERGIVVLLWKSSREDGKMHRATESESESERDRERAREREKSSRCAKMESIFGDEVKMVQITMLPA